MPERHQGFFFLTNSTTGAQFEIDLSCAWKSWLLNRNAENICNEEYTLTRNLSVATALIGLIAILLLPLLVYLLASGRLSELKTPGGLEAKFREISKRKVENFVVELPIEN